MVGFHLCEKMSYLDGFYAISMIATGQGLSQIPSTQMGKLFASLMAFVSAGVVVAFLGFLLGPFLGRLWRIGIEKLEEEAQIIREKVEGKKK